MATNWKNEELNTAYEVLKPFKAPVAWDKLGHVVSVSWASGIMRSTLFPGESDEKFGIAAGLVDQKD